MNELTTTVNLVEYSALEGGSPITAVLARSELEAVLDAEESAQLWFELGRDEGEETRLLTLAMASADIEEMLRRSTDDEVLLALDGEALASLFDDPDVEAHGMRAALAVAVATAAIAAPASLAATPQTASAASTAQRVGAAATSQQVGVASTAQVSRVAAKAQISGVAAKSQISRSLVVRAGGIKLMRSGLAR